VVIPVLDDVADRQARLATVVDRVRQRWGERALRFGTNLLALPASAGTHVLSTGSVSLDLLTGGLPRGALTEIAGLDGSGVELLGQTVLARAQAGGALTLLVDAGMTTDPDSLAAVGIDLERLVLACPVTAPDAWSILEAVGRSDSVDLIVAFLLGLTNAPGATPAVLHWGLTRLAAALRGGGTAVLLVSTPVGRRDLGAPPQLHAVRTIGGAAITQAAALRILLTPDTPRLTPYGAIAALRAAAAVVKHHGLPRGPIVSLEMTEQGVHRALDYVTLGMRVGVISETRLGLVFEGCVLGRTPLMAAATLGRTPALAEDIDRRIRAQMDQVGRRVEPAADADSGVA